jgi:hypothetical protein
VVICRFVDVVTQKYSGQPPFFFLFAVSVIWDQT